MLKVGVEITFISVVIFSGVLWGFGVYYQILMIINRKPDVELFTKELLFNPFNMQLCGNMYLTDKGLKSRNKSWKCFGLFFGIIAIFFVTSFILTEMGIDLEKVGIH